MAKYNKTTIESICSYIRDGDTQKTACRKAGVGHTTFHEWLNNKPEFAERIKKAKEDFLDTITGKLEATLWKRATGYEVTETETEYVSDKDGNPKIKSQKEKVKHIQPDTGALIFALTNVAGDKWKNKINSEVNADVKAEATVEQRRYNLKDIPDEKLFELADALQDGESERLREKHNTNRKE